MVWVSRSCHTCNMLRVMREVFRCPHLEWDVDYEHEELGHGEGGEEHARVDVVPLPGLHRATNYICSALKFLSSGLEKEQKTSNYLFFF